MKREHLLREIAESGYSIVYSAKKHFATYDIVEKAPGWIRLATICVGIVTLAFPHLKSQAVGVAISAVGVASIYFGSFIDQRQRYSEAGSRLISLFNRLRPIYNEVKSLEDGESAAEWEAAYRTVVSESEGVMMTKHIFLSDWYAHYKLFWQAQIGWLDEQLHFSFWRDKVPLTLSLTAGATLVAAVIYSKRHLIDFCVVMP